MDSHTLNMRLKQLDATGQTLLLQVDELIDQLEVFSQALDQLQELDTVTEASNHYYDIPPFEN